MYTRFYENTIVTKFIKSLVASTYVPTVKVWKPGDFVIKGLMYVSHDGVYKCMHTGTPESLNSYTKPSDGVNAAPERFFIRANTYSFGRHYYGVTSNYKSNISGYDSETHYWLGQYLRAVRDLYDLDLMPFYNCYSNEYIDGFSFKDGIITEYDSRYKIISVPVKFGQTYTIGINSRCPVEMMCAFYGKKGLIQSKTELLNSITESGTSDTITNSTYKVFYNTSFANPITYKTKTWKELSSQSYEDTDAVIDYLDDRGLGQFERFLRLLIKVPYGVDTSIVVIEGDYSYKKYGVADNGVNIESSVNSKLVNGGWVRPSVVKNILLDSEDIDGVQVPTETIGEKVTLPLYSPFGLLQISSGISFAFSNRLIEYLLLNVIDSTETIGDNIKRIQEYSISVQNKIQNGVIYTGPIVAGVWNSELREYLFELVKNSRYLTTKVDLTGFVDRGTESIITRGQGV